MIKFRMLLSIALFLLAMSASAQTVFGKWKTFDDKTGDAKSIVEITERNGKLYGKVIELLNPDMKDVKCKDCPDGDKDKPVLGIEVLKGLSKDGDKYSNGKILDPSSGKTYKCTLSLDGDNTLKVRGYIGFAALGRTQTWKRVEE